MNLLEAQWKEQLCPLEKVKKWKQGFALKCPRLSEVCWCQDKDKSILMQLRNKRSGFVCPKCREELRSFLSKFGGVGE